MKKQVTNSRAMAAALAGILTGAMLATACNGAAEAETKSGDKTEANGCKSANSCKAHAGDAAKRDGANGCNGANGCSGDAKAAPPPKAEANGCNGANGCNSASE
jgi:hypothetical protein